MRRRRSPFRRSQTETVVQGGPGPGPPQGLPPESPGERELWPWLLAFLILVLGGLAALYLLSQDDDKKTPTDTATTIQVTTNAGTETTATTVAKPATTGVPRVVGLRSAQAVERLREAGLEPVVKSIFSERPNGIVASQAPSPGTEAAPGSKVTLNVSKGERAVTVPDTLGQQEAEAAATLRAAGFGAAIYDVPSPDPKGTVVAQEPRGGVTAPKGSSVRINVSSGEPVPSGGGTVTEPVEREESAEVTVPNVVGQARKAAGDALRAAGLKPSTVYVPSDEPEGTVVAQSPKPGTTLKRGEAVQTNISKGPNPKADKAIPDVLGLAEPTATDKLEKAGFVVEVVQAATTDPAQDGKVVDQQPVSGERAPAGATVTITVGFLTG